jgi:hypothetical protein
MVDATISRARLRDLACLGRFRLPDAGGAGLSASVRFTPPRPRAVSSRPEEHDFMASPI